MGPSALPLILLLMSFIHSGLTQDLPTSTLTVTPDSTVFTGETVNLKCEIESNYSDWRYEWYKDCTELQTSDRYTVNRDTLTIRGVTESDQGQYWCRGQRDGRPNSSESSFDVQLNVNDKPQPSLTVNPQSPVFTGETVTLSCDVGQLTGWTIHWRKDSNPESTGDATKTIESVSVSDGGNYWCRAERGNYYSEFSNTAEIEVKELPTSTLTVTPASPVFTGETVNLTCAIESHSNWRWRNGLTYDWRYNRKNGWTYDWRYEWYKGTDSVMLQTSEHYTVNGDTLTIRGVNESDQDQYWCRGQRDRSPKSSQDSNQINLSVNGHISIFNILSFLLAACPYLLSTVVLLFKCYKARVTSTEGQSQYTITQEET